MKKAETGKEKQRAEKDKEGKMEQRKSIKTEKQKLCKNQKWEKRNK